MATQKRRDLWNKALKRIQKTENRKTDRTVGGLNCYITNISSGTAWLLQDKALWSVVIIYKRTGWTQFLHSSLSLEDVFVEMEKIFDCFFWLLVPFFSNLKHTIVEPIFSLRLKNIYVNSQNTSLTHKQIKLRLEKHFYSIIEIPFTH